MKQIFSIILISVVLFTFSGCSDSEYTDKYLDPSKTSVVSCEKLMTGIFKTAYDYTMPSYLRYFTFDIPEPGRYAQIIGFVNSTNRYQGMGESYNNDRWKNFYNTLTQFRLLEYTYDNLSDTDKSNYEVFVLLSKVFLYEQLQQIIDLWGDVPFSEAGYLAITGDVRSSYPGYDNVETLYKMMLDDLKDINSILSGMNNLSSLTTAYLSAQDYINGGDLLKWRKYANSLRLRMAMRLSSNGSLASDAKSILNEMLGNSTTYPVVDSNDETIKIKADTDGFKVLEGIREGFESWSGQCNRASKTMIDALTDDPRLDIIYDKNAEGLYVGIDTEDSETVQKNLFERPTSEGGNYYSAVDTATFSRNELFPGILMTAAEVSFIKAEAYQKGYASGDAQAAFEKGVRESVTFYYQLNSTATYRTPTSAPSNNDITDFATSRWSAYSSKEVAIGTQKWLHFSLIQMLEAWDEVRRTGIPALSFQTDNGSVGCPNVPDRLRYPLDERNNNAENYNGVQSKDNYYTKLFWAK
ncbi:MAG: SusD/RagB family nutrient-binding outer membrane lipoprotein [Mediterranea sp.]|jgi:hypothetical protein|nr:SusD/RagB family nutrient-binding outer membrane lipoprotein [Mediterranea sp.]